MDKCSCGLCEYKGNPYSYSPVQTPDAWFEIHGAAYPKYCRKCGDQLLPDGRVIQRETVPNKLMSMLKEVQATCPESGLQEFALRVFNWIEELRGQAGLTGERLSNNAGINRGAYKEFADNCLNSPGEIYLSTIFRLLNAAKQEAKQ